VEEEHVIDAELNVNKLTLFLGGLGGYMLRQNDGDPGCLELCPGWNALEAMLTAPKIERRRGLCAPIIDVVKANRKDDLWEMIYSGQKHTNLPTHYRSKF
jgi:hypothetical protein